MCLFSNLVKNPKYQPNKKNGFRPDYEKMAKPDFDKRVLAVPIGCGFCMECRKQKAREWQIRLMEDVRKHTNGKFITLTFSNESIKELAKEVTRKTHRIKATDAKGEPIIKKEWKDKNGRTYKRYKYKRITQEIILEGYETDNAIATEATRRFTERWRKEFGNAPRHWFITELGHRGTENIHIHGIIWTDNIKAITKHWQYGYVWDGKKKNKKIINYVDERTATYITKYVHKMDYDHRYYRPKILTSAGIGGSYFERTDWINQLYEGEKTKNYYRSRTGYKMSLPIYYKNKMYSDEEREKLWIQQLNKECRYVGGEKVSTKNGYKEYYNLLAWYRAKNARLGYGNGEIDWDMKKYEEQRRNFMIDKRINSDHSDQVGVSPTGRETSALDSLAALEWTEKSGYEPWEKTIKDWEFNDWIEMSSESQEGEIPF